MVNIHGWRRRLELDETPTTRNSTNCGSNILKHDIEFFSVFLGSYQFFLVLISFFFNFLPGFSQFSQFFFFFFRFLTAFLVYRTCIRLL